MQTSSITIHRRRWLASAAAFGAAAVTPAARAGSAAPKLFELQMRRGAQRLHESTAVLQGADGTWRRHWLAVDELNYDVVRNASLLRPTLGTLGLKLALRTGAAHAQRRSAEQDRTAPLAAGAARFVRYDLWFRPEGTHWSFMDGDASMSSQSEMVDRQWWSVTAASARAAATLDAAVIAAFTTPTPRA
jgi:hypothetical protein